MTRKGKKLYDHVNELLAGSVSQTGVRADDVKKIRLPAAGTEFRFSAAGSPAAIRISCLCFWETGRNGLTRSIL